MAERDQMNGEGQERERGVFPLRVGSMDQCNPLRAAELLEFLRGDGEFS